MVFCSAGSSAFWALAAGWCFYFCVHPERVAWDKVGRLLEPTVFIFNVVDILVDSYIL